MKKKPLGKMNLGELREATKEFDQEFVAFTGGKPLTEQQWEMHRRAARASERRRSSGQPGKDAQRINITVESALLARVDKLARARGINRSELIAQSLRSILPKAG